MQFTKATTFFALAALFASAIAAPAPSLPSVKELEIENVKPALNNGDINRSTQETDVIAKDNTVSDSSKNVGQCSGDRVLACCNDSNWNPAAKGAFTALNGLGQGVLKCTQIPTSVPVGVLGGAGKLFPNDPLIDGDCEE